MGKLASCEKNKTMQVEPVVRKPVFGVSNQVPHKPAKLICVFVFTYAKSLFSHDAAQLIMAFEFSLPNK